jgi:glycosyltransferase involved in cell wall biosynthesis
MKIAILADLPVGLLPGFGEIPPPAGHYPTWLEAMVPEFGKLPGLDIHWVVMCKGLSAPLTRKSLGQTFHLLPRSKKSLAMFTAYTIESRCINRILKSLKPDLVHSWGSEDVYGLTSARWHGSARLFTLQGCLTECVKRDVNPHFLLRLQASFEPFTVRRHSQATGESPDAVAKLRQLHPAIHAYLVDYGVSPEFFSATWRPASTATLLYAGALSQAKGIRELIEAFRSPALSSVQLRLAGSGELSKWVAAQALPNVSLLGRLDRPSLILEMENAWALVVPTHADTGPSVLKEARVVGLPVIVSTAAGASHYIRESGAGELVPAADSHALRLAISRVLQNSEICRALGARSWQADRDRFHPSTAALAFAALYRQASMPEPRAISPPICQTPPICD